MKFLRGFNQSTSKPFPIYINLQRNHIWFTGYFSAEKTELSVFFTSNENV